jgi:hypothetical protein
MITLKFPKLDNALSKQLKDEPANSPLRGVIVLYGKAIVFRDTFCLVVDLEDYFVLDCAIEDDGELETLEGILLYMHGKVFSQEFWSELTKGASMKMSNGALFVENPRYSKDLHYKEIDIDMIEPLANLAKASSYEEKLVGSIALNFHDLKQVYYTLSSSFKTDQIILQFKSQDAFVKFTFRMRKHFYGYFYPNYNAVQEAFRFDALEMFVQESAEMLDDLRNQTPPPPPPTELLEYFEDAVVENDNQLRLVE